MSEHANLSFSDDSQRKETHRWDALHEELGAALAAPESDFVLLDAKSTLAEARRRRETKK